MRSGGDWKSCGSEVFEISAYNPVHDFGKGYIYVESEPAIKCAGMDFELGDMVRFNSDFGNEYMHNETNHKIYAVKKEMMGFLEGYAWYGTARVRVPVFCSKEYSIIHVPSAVLSAYVLSADALSAEAIINHHIGWRPD